MGRLSIQRSFWVFWGLAAQLLFVQFATGLSADEQEHRLVTLGLKIFLPFLAADEDLPAKVDTDGHIQIAVVYLDNPRHAEEMAERLRQTPVLKGIPLNVSTVSLKALLQPSPRTPTGVFLSERLGGELPTLVQWGIEHQVLTFSPFAGEIEGGVLGGILITDRILPYVNMRTLQSSGIRLKPFFLKIAEPYE